MNLLSCVFKKTFKKTNKISSQNYSSFHTFSTNNERAAGGVSIFVSNTAPHSRTPKDTNLKTVARSTNLHRVVSLCSIYIPPNSRLSQKDLDDLVSQQPSPCLLLGDFHGGVPKILMTKVK